MKRKILYSPGYGAGWTTWNDGKVAKYMLTHEATIKAVESGKGLAKALEQLKQECKDKFNKDYVCVLGARDLRVLTVYGRVKIDDCEGNESVTEQGDFSEWM